MADERINLTALRTAHLTCLALATVFLLWSVGLLVLFATMNIARPERLGYFFCTLAASISLWIVWWMLRQARNPKLSRRR